MSALTDGRDNFVSADARLTGNQCSASGRPERTLMIQHHSLTQHDRPLSLCTPLPPTPRPCSHTHSHLPDGDCVHTPDMRDTSWIFGNIVNDSKLAIRRRPGVQQYCSYYKSDLTGRIKAERRSSNFTNWCNDFLNKCVRFLLLQLQWIKTLWVVMKLNQ